MILVVLIILLAPLIFVKGLSHWSYGAHVVAVALATLIVFPILEYPFWRSTHLYFLVFAHLLSLTVIVFALYGWDKRQAKNGGWRVPEKTLHALACMGGTLGAFAGGEFFRHKTSKKEFKKTFYLIAGTQAALVALVLWAP